MTVDPLAMPGPDPTGPLPDLEPVEILPVWRLHWEPNVLAPTPHIPGRWRFDAPNGEFAVSYGNVSCDHAYVEVYGDTDAIDANQIGRSISCIEASEALRVVDLGDAAITRAIGTDLRLATDEHYNITRAWGVRIRQWWSDADAIRYPGRKGGRPDNYCFWLDRCADKLRAEKRGAVGDNPDETLRICTTYNLRPLFLNPPSSWV